METKIEEIWKDVIGYESFYKISNLGRVYSYRKKRILSHCISNGYPMVWLTNNTQRKYTRIHRLIAIHFIPNPENKPEVNHIDGVKNNNDISNLEWVTSSENCRHAFAMGLTVAVKGTRNARAVLDNLSVKVIRDVCSFNKYPHRMIASYFKVTQQNINDIYHRKRWLHVD